MQNEEKKEKCDYCEGLGFRTESIENDIGGGDIEQVECQKCRGKGFIEPTPSKTNEWKEMLSMMLSILFNIEPTIHNDNISIEQFISTLLKQREEEIEKEWRNKLSVLSENANIEQDINKIRYWIKQLLNK